MQPEQLHEDKFLRVLWDENPRIIGIEWKEATSTMTSEEFKTELTIFAGHVEEKKAPGILVDVSSFRHKMEPEVQQWRVKNISTRYTTAGVQRFAFLFPSGAQIPPMMNQSSPEETFLTRAFNDIQQAEDWLTGVSGRRNG
jgi:hypothetical protein